MNTAPITTQGKRVVVARLTATRAIGVKTIVEVYADAKFGSFYEFFTQDGARRSTKKHIRTANRNEGLTPWYRAYRMTPGLEVLAEHLRTLPQINKVTVRILKRRAYRTLLAVAPDVLGLTKVQHQPDPRLMPKPAFGIPAYIPQGYTTIKKRMDIILGRG